MEWVFGEENTCAVDQIGQMQKGKQGRILKCRKDFQNQSFLLAISQFSSNYTSSYPYFSQYQYFNKLPGMNAFCQKDNLARLMRKQPQLSPMSFILPEEGQLLESWWNSMPVDIRPVLIQKPIGSLGGKGIKLTKSLRNIQRQLPAVVQVYEDDVLLYRGHKFDIRVFVIITSVRPFVGFYYRRGFIKIAKKQYEKPNLENLNETSMHLTNLAANSISKNIRYKTLSGFRGFQPWISFSQNMTARDFNFKDYYAQLFEEMDDQAFRTYIEEQIISACEKIFATVYDEMLYQAGMTKQLQIHKQFFNAIGLDIYFDRNGKAKVYEMNSNPTYQSFTNLETYPSAEIIRDLLNQVNIKFKVDNKNVYNPLSCKGCKHKESEIQLTEQQIIDLNKEFLRQQRLTASQNGLFTELNLTKQKNIIYNWNDGKSLMKEIYE